MSDFDRLATVRTLFDDALADVQQLAEQDAADQEAVEAVTQRVAKLMVQGLFWTELLARMSVLGAGAGSWMAENKLFRQLELMKPGEKWLTPYQLSDQAWDKLEEQCHAKATKAMIEFKKKQGRGRAPWSKTAADKAAAAKGGKQGRGRGKGR